jgi:hypothetical protein
MDLIGRGGFVVVQTRCWWPPAGEHWMYPGVVSPE